MLDSSFRGQYSPTLTNVSMLYTIPLTELSSSWKCHVFSGKLSLNSKLECYFLCSIFSFSQACRGVPNQERFYLLSSISGEGFEAHSESTHGTHPFSQTYGFKTANEAKNEPGWGEKLLTPSRPCQNVRDHTETHESYRERK